MSRSALFGLAALAIAALTQVLASDTHPQRGRLDFVDVASAVGVDAVIYCGTKEKRHILESGGSGVILFDFDADGWLDLYLPNAFSIDEENRVTRHPHVLYRNTGRGRFEDLTRRAGVGATEWGNGGCVGDYNADGHLDLYVTNFGPNLLYKNNGDGTFTDVTAAAGVGDPRWSTGCSFLDSDKDGDLDLYVANYIDCDWKNVMEHHPKLLRVGLVEVLAGPQGYPGAEDVYYRNNGDGTFTDATREAGLVDQGKFFGFGVASSDYDNDGDMDLYVANDADRNYLYQNDGKGKFTDVALWNGAGFSGEGVAQASMGVDFADYDSDGWIDIITTNFAFQSDTLYRNLGSAGMFFDVSSDVNLTRPTFVPLAWGISFFDADHDADLDLFIANGHIYPQVDRHPELGESFRQKNLLLRNDGRAFTDVSSEAGSGLQIEKSSRGAAFGDLDNDGDIDIVVSNMDDRPTVLENRSVGSGNWLLVRLRGGPGDFHGIGARIRLKAGPLVQVHEVRSGSSYVSQNDLRAHFGLGRQAKADEITVLWPDGTRQVLTGVAANQILDVEKPK
jgi:hypothetical protein